MKQRKKEKTKKQNKFITTFPVRVDNFRLVNYNLSSPTRVWEVEQNTLLKLCFNVMKRTRNQSNPAPVAMCPIAQLIHSHDTLSSHTQV